MGCGMAHLLSSFTRRFEGQFSFDTFGLAATLMGLAKQAICISSCNC